jgi:hypothetical protein
MRARVPAWAAPARAPIDEPFTWLSLVLRLVGVAAMALLWWALAFLAWQRAGPAAQSPSWLPSLPLLFTDLEVAIFGPIGASLVVVALLRQGRLAFLSVLLGYLVAALLTLTRSADAYDKVLSATESQLMLAVCAIAAYAGLAIGAIAIRSLRSFGLLGLLAVAPVASLIAVLLDPGAGLWLTRSALVVLLVMIAWRPWSGVLLWPIFFALLWLLTLVMSAVGYGAQRLNPPAGGGASLGSLAHTMLDYVRSAWSTLLQISWDLFWPAAVIAALVVAFLYIWRRSEPVPASDLNSDQQHITGGSAG